VMETIGVNNLEGHEAFETALPSLVHPSHVALAEQLKQEIAAEVEEVAAILRDLVGLPGRQSAAPHQIAEKFLSVRQLAGALLDFTPVSVIDESSLPDDLQDSCRGRERHRAIPLDCWIKHA